MYGYGFNMDPANRALTNELASDLWIQQNIPGGLNSPLGEYLDNAMGGNPNPTFGQIVGGYPGVGGFPGYGGFSYGSGYGYGYNRW